MRYMACTCHVPHAGHSPDITYAVATNPGIEHQHTPCKCKDVTRDRVAVVNVATPVSVHVPK